MFATVQSIYCSLNMSQEQLSIQLSTSIKNYEQFPTNDYIHKV